MSSLDRLSFMSFSAPSRGALVLQYPMHERGSRVFMSTDKVGAEGNAQIKDSDVRSKEDMKSLYLMQRERLMHMSSDERRIEVDASFYDVPGGNDMMDRLRGEAGCAGCVAFDLIVLVTLTFGTFISLRYGVFPDLSRKDVRLIELLLFVWWFVNLSFCYGLIRDPDDVDASEMMCLLQLCNFVWGAVLLGSAWLNG